MTQVGKIKKVNELLRQLNVESLRLIVKKAESLIEEEKRQKLIEEAIDKKDWWEVSQLGG